MFSCSHNKGGGFICSERHGGNFLSVASAAFQPLATKRVLLGEVGLGVSGNDARSPVCIPPWETGGGSGDFWFYKYIYINISIYFLFLFFFWLPLARLELFAGT
ncbi:UNVERIFIED_CONTAM: hypothetical protein K2H54_077179 [Gekko kuhli]